jgi:hypothetical protein
VSLRLDLPRLATAIVLIGIFAMAVRVPASPDMWWHLRCGEVQWRTRAVLKTETFSHTAPGAPWIDQSWLPQLGMYGLYRLGAFPALALAVGAVVAVAFGLLLPAARAKDGPSTWWSPYWRAFVLLWAAIASGPTWAARPHLLTLLLTSAWVLLLARWRANGYRPRDLLWLPPLMLLWANSHGGYIVGLLLLSLEAGGLALDGAIGRAQRALSFQRVGASPRGRPGGQALIAAGVCTLVATLNPQGFDLLLFPFRTLGSVQQAAIAEWSSPDFHAPELWPFLALMLATWGALALSGKRQIDEKGFWPDLLRALVLTGMALRSSRYIGLAAVILVPLLVRHGESALRETFAGIGKGLDRDPSLPSRAHGWPALNWTVLALVVLAASVKVAQPLNAQIIARVHQERFPVAATRILYQQELPPELYNEYAWGGYLIWANANASSRWRVFIDGRADPYGDELIQAYQRVASVRPGWEETLDQYDVHTALLGAKSALRMVMVESANWREVYADEVAAILVR